MTDQRQQVSSAIKISVVATVRNERASIADFVETLLSQTVAPAEIVIVDGESSDGTQEILQAYASAGKITLISQACNIAQGRNLGIAKAGSPFIAVTDAAPMPPLIATAPLDADAVGRLRGAFAAAGAAPELDAQRSTLLLRRFALPEPSSYDMFHGVLEAAEQHAGVW